MDTTNIHHIIVILMTIGCLIHQLTCDISASEGSIREMELRLEPSEAVIRSGENVTFTCSSSSNRSLSWNLNNGQSFPYKTVSGTSVDNETSEVLYWTKLIITYVKRTMSSEITCVSEDERTTAVGFLIVNGVQIGGNCNSAEDCITENAVCRSNICECPKNEVLLRLTKHGYEVCRKIINRLYDPCEFSEQCFHLVDSRSVCASNGVCVCSVEATDVNGKCLSKSEVSYNKNQDLYRVGLVAVTCLIIIIIVVSLWVTFKRNCNDRALTSADNTEANRANEVIMEISEDKPPSYDDILEIEDNVTAAPPNIKDALKYSMTAKRLLRQVSAPAGQLLSRASSLSINPMKARRKNSKKNDR